MNFIVQKRDNNSIYFTMPPAKYSAIASIIAKKDGYVDSEPLIIDNSFYWEKIEDPELEYLASHTFYLKSAPPPSNLWMWFLAILVIVIVVVIALVIFIRRHR